MRKIILASFILIYLNSFGQTWCDTGANWNYSYSNGFGIEGYTQINYIGDILINGQNAKKLTKTLIAYDFINSQGVLAIIGNEYTYENNGVAYILYENNWDTLYNFNANIGDSWRMAKQPITNACDSNSRLTVLATGTKNINSISLKYLVVEFNYGSSLTDTIIEKIGFIGGFMFPYDQCNGALNLNEGGQFRCYSDDLFNTYKPNYTEDFSFITGIDENLIKTNLSLFPNPTSGNFTLRTNEKENMLVQIKDLSGTIVMSFIFNDEKEIDAISWNNGIYVMLIITSKNVITKKIIIAH